MSGPIYGNGINQMGLWSPVPMRLRYDSETQKWWDESGNFSIDHHGSNRASDVLYSYAGTFEEVRAWTCGVKDSMQMLKNWLYGKVL